MPCEVKYDLILKLETHDEDTEFLIRCSDNDNDGDDDDDDDDDGSDDDNDGDDDDQEAEPDRAAGALHHVEAQQQGSEQHRRLRLLCL